MSPNTQAMITEAFASDVYVQNQMDVQHTPLYDTVVIAAGSAITVLSSAFFTNVGAASNKSVGLTNMTQQQRLPSPEAFSIFGIRFRVAENILLADLEAVMGLGATNGFALETILGQKVYNRAPIWFYAAGGGIFASQTLTATSIYTNGLPSREAMHKLAIPIVIENNMTFYSQLNGNSYTLTASASGGTGITMVTLLDGLYARGVQ